MKKKEINELWEKTEKQLKELGEKIVVVARDIKKDAVYGAKVSKIGIEKLSLEARRKKIYTDVGREAYKLYTKDKISDQVIAKLCKRVDELNKKIARKEKLSSTLKKELDKGAGKAGSEKSGSKTKRKKSGGSKRTVKNS